MKSIILPLITIAILSGCATVTDKRVEQPVVKNQSPPSLDIQISHAYAGETNAYLKGKIIFSGLDDFDFSQGDYGIRYRYYYVGGDDVLPRIDQFGNLWRIMGDCESNTWDLNEIYPVKINTEERAYLMILASICESESTNDMVRVWCMRKINWKQ